MKLLEIPQVSRTSFIEELSDVHLLSLSCTPATMEKGTLESGWTFGFFLGGALDPLRPLPAGISVVANFVKLGTFLAFEYHWMKSCSSLFSAAATECAQIPNDLQFGHILSQAYCPFFLRETQWGRDPE